NARLGLQHRVWRPRATDAWRRAGFTVGHTLIDLGCGPGYAALDLAEIVGATGRVVAIDRSRRFLDALGATARQRGLAHLGELGLEIIASRLLVDVARPRDYLWQWPRAFVDVGIQRLVDVGRIDAARARSMASAFDEVESTPHAFQVMPTVIEILATRR